MVWTLNDQKWPRKAYIGILKATIMDFILYNLDRFNSGTISNAYFWFVDNSAFSLVSLNHRSWKLKSCNYEHFQISTDNSITATLNYKDKESIDYNELLGIYHHNGIITSKSNRGQIRSTVGQMRSNIACFAWNKTGYHRGWHLNDIFSRFGVKSQWSFSNWMRCC